MRELKEVFGQISASNFEAIVARLAVLYEDLRIELHGIAEESIPAMDELDVRYRRIYFLRKSIGTLWEFAQAVGQLQVSPEFRTISADFPPEVHRHWKRAAAFFMRNEAQLRLVRNDTGGHFGLEAARHAVLHFEPDAVMGIEIDGLIARRSRIFLRFSGEVVATAMLRHAWGASRENRVARLVKVARVGYRHATRCVHCIVVCYLWDKFGK
jgi:hypothetical protein